MSMEFCESTGYDPLDLEVMSMVELGIEAQRHRARIEDHEGAIRALAAEFESRGYQEEAPAWERDGINYTASTRVSKRMSVDIDKMRHIIPDTWRKYVKDVPDNAKLKTAIERGLVEDWRRFVTFAESRPALYITKAEVKD